MPDADLTLYAAFGFLGVALYLGSYAALQLGYLNGQGGAYAILNLAAASSVLISLVQAFNFSSAVIQVFWIIISVVGLVRMYVLTHRIRFNDEERAFLDTALPGLAKAKGRKFLDAGYWVSGAAGTELTHEGEPVEHMVYLAGGSAEIISNGKKIAVCEAGSFIGELTAITGDPATASVRLAEESRYFCIGADVLRRRLLRDQEFRSQLQNSVSREALRKLIRSNQLLASGASAAEAD